MAGFAVQHPDSRLVHPYDVKQSSFYGEDKSVGGYYSFCIDNQNSFSGKLIELYVSSFKIGGWQKYEKELEELHLNVQNFTVCAELHSNFQHLKLKLISFEEHHRYPGEKHE